MGHSCEQSALLTQETHTFAKGSQRGAAFGHWEFCKQPTHCPVSGLQVRAVDEAQSVSRKHRTQRPRVSQVGASAGHGAPPAQLTRQCPLDSHALPVGQSEELAHCTHTFLESQRGRTGVQSKSLRHWTHECVAESQ
jgi:hypothetical protein